MSPVDWSRYPANWKAIRARILERAGNRCEECGVPNHTHVTRDGERAVFIVLTVAHVNHDTTDNDEANLRAWCQRCHLRHDHELHQRHAAETRRKRRQAAGQREMAL